MAPPRNISTYRLANSLDNCDLRAESSLALLSSILIATSQQSAVRTARSCLLLGLAISRLLLRHGWSATIQTCSNFEPMFVGARSRVEIEAADIHPAAAVVVGNGRQTTSAVRSDYVHVVCTYTYVYIRIHV